MAGSGEPWRYSDQGFQPKAEIPGLCDKDLGRTHHKIGKHRENIRSIAEQFASREQSCWPTGAKVSVF